MKQSLNDWTLRGNKTVSDNNTVFFENFYTAASGQLATHAKVMLASIAVTRKIQRKSIKPERYSSSVTAP